MPNPAIRNIRAFVVVVVVMLGVCPLPSHAQSVWEKMKEAARKAQQQKQQPQQQKQQPQQQSGQRPGQRQKPGQQQAAGQGQAEDSGPIVPPPGTKIAEKVLAPVQQGAQFFVSPHGMHVATVGLSGSRATVIYDGVEGPKFDEILGEPVFSPDGNRYAYCARSGDQFVVTVDGKELTRSPESNQGSFSGQSCALGFTSNSKHVYYLSFVSKTSSTGETYTRFVFDGKVSVPSGFSQDSPVPVFSPDGDHYAYIWNDPAKQRPWALIVDGKPAGYSGSAPQWSADSKHLYTQVVVNLGLGRGTVMDVLLDGKPIMRALQVTLYIPPVGDMVVAAVTAGASAHQPLRFLVIGGKKVVGSEVDGIRGTIEQVVFSPDGKHYAAKYRDPNNKVYVIVDGKKGLEYQTIDALSFTADSSKVVYRAYVPPKTFVVVGEQESDAFPGLVNPVVAPAGNRVGALLEAAANAQVFLDGKTTRVNTNHVSELSFSPDGTHYAYLAAENVVGPSRLVPEGVPQPNSAVGGPDPGRQGTLSYVWSPDSEHIAHFAFPPTPTGNYERGLFLDGKYISFGAAPGAYTLLTFTPDSKHLLWVRNEVVDGVQGFRIFVDGKPAAAGTYAGGNFFYNIPGSWDVSPEGTLSFLAQDDNSLKRISVTPSPDTSLDTLLAGGR